jgi:hypothetical protein
VNTTDENSKTRRVILRAGLTALGGAAAAAAAAARANQQTAQTKIAQKMVQYQDTPKGDQKCSICVNFEAPNGCKIVEGTINPNGWCIAFGPKSS